MDKEQKRALRKQAKDAMRAEADAEWERHMVLEPGELKELLEYLDEQLASTGCDHTLRLTEAWARLHGADPGELARSVEHFGGGCDCEVLANVDPETAVDGWPLYQRTVPRG